MRKKSLYLLIIVIAATLLLILGGTQVNAAASDEYATISGNYTYWFVTKEDTEYGNIFETIEEVESLGLSVDHAVIVKYIGNEKNVTIPSKVFGYPIKQIEDFNGFRGCSTIENVTIPSTIEYIGDYCFADCKKLSSINLPDNMETISSNTFKNCTSLRNITIPKTVTYIGNNAFSGCKNLTIKCAPNSRALQYAFNEGIKYSLTSKVNIKSNKNVYSDINTESKTYSGKAKKTDIYIDYGFALTDQYDNYTYGYYKLINGTDYTVSYKNNTKIGTATVTITGKGNYTGTITKTFKILPKKASISSVKNSSKKSAKIKWKRDSSVTGYEVYVSERVADKNYMKTTAELTLRSKPTTSSKAIDVLPKGAKVKILKKNAKKANGYTWYKVSIYYTEECEPHEEVGYVASKYLTTVYKAKSYKKVKTITSNKTTSYTAKKLTKGKTYYVKVRSYKTVNGKKYYGAYSSVKSVKIKK